MGMLEDAIRAYATYEDRTTDPATPGSGETLVYVKDGKLHTVDDGGTVVEYGAGGGDGGATFVGAAAYLSGNQTVPQNSTDPIEWDAQHYDEGGLLDLAGANPERFTIPAGEGGWYVASFTFFIEDPTGPQVTSYIGINGLGGSDDRRVLNAPSWSGVSAAVHLSDVVEVLAGDHVLFAVRQSTGSSRDVLGAANGDRTFASLVKLG